MSEQTLTVDQFMALFKQRTGRDLTLDEKDPFRIEKRDDKTAIFEGDRLIVSMGRKPIPSFPEGIAFFDLVWFDDAVGQPDLSLKGINRFKGRWEGEPVA